MTKQKKSEHPKGQLSLKVTETYYCKHLMKSGLPCRYMSKIKTNFFNHTRTHTGEKPFECPHCHKKVIAFGNWKDHVRRHEGVRNFSCPLKGCGVKFYRRNQLVEHGLETRVHKNHSEEFLKQLEDHYPKRRIVAQKPQPLGKSLVQPKLEISDKPQNEECTTNTKQFPNSKWEEESAGTFDTQFELCTEQNEQSFDQNEWSVSLSHDLSQGKLDSIEEFLYLYPFSKNKGMRSSASIFRRDNGEILGKSFVDSASSTHTDQEDEYPMSTLVLPSRLSLNNF
jgi:hypothetical protein